MVWIVSDVERYTSVETEMRGTGHRRILLGKGTYANWVLPWFRFFTTSIRTQQRHTAYTNRAWPLASHHASPFVKLRPKRP